jgi:beta-galactosidase/beta-glucuronidase
MMRRDEWLNLNGLWEYAIRSRDGEMDTTFDGKILVPFPVESALSGVGKRVGEAQCLWYRRTFKIPQSWSDERVLLHFEAVDWETRVWVNSKTVGSHRGGYDPFTFDVTRVMDKRVEQQTIVVAVWDPTDAGTQPRGKQVNTPRGIFYTPTTGIWRTVWLEPVPEASISELRMVPDIDLGKLTVTVQGRDARDADLLSVVATDAKGRQVASASGKFDSAVELKIENLQLWSPDNPTLYELTAQLTRDGRVIDQVESYFGMRKISLGKDEKGITRLMLNDEFVFQLGPLDQGFWPDGLYTAPSDEALRYDIEVMKKMGFNMLRKHVKVEPRRF